MKPLLAAAALAMCGSGAFAADSDWAHDAIQQFLYDVGDGLDFGQPEFGEIVAPGDAEKLKALQDCELKEVTRTAGDVIAIVHFLCGDEPRRTASVMLSFEERMIAEIDVVSFVQVDVN